MPKALASASVTGKSYNALRLRRQVFMFTAMGHGNDPGFVNVVASSTALVVVSRKAISRTRINIPCLYACTHNNKECRNGIGSELFLTAGLQIRNFWTLPGRNHNSAPRQDAGHDHAGMLFKTRARISSLCSFFGRGETCTRGMFLPMSGGIRGWTALWPRTEH